MRLGSTHRLPVDQREITHAILFSSFQQDFQILVILLAVTDHERAVSAVFDRQIAADPLHHLRALDVQNRLQAARLRVIARVNNAAVGFGLPHRRIAFLFQ